MPLVILDFSNVLGLDSSAAQSIAKLKSYILQNFTVEILLFVTGHADGFRCSYDLSQKVVDIMDVTSIRISSVEHEPQANKKRLSLAAGAVATIQPRNNFIAEIPNSHVCTTLDSALIFAEDVLIALEDPTVFQDDCNDCFPILRSSSHNTDEVRSILETLCPDATEDEIEVLYQCLSPENYISGDTVWNQDDESDSLKVIVDGTLVSLLEDEKGATESICSGSMIGELGVVNNTRRLTTVKVFSQEATLYSMSKEKWDFLSEQKPRVARHIHMLVIRYLAHRVQHVSNHNILDKRSLPV